MGVCWGNTWSMGECCNHSGNASRENRDFEWTIDQTSTVDIDLTYVLKHYTLFGLCELDDEALSCKLPKIIYFYSSTVVKVFGFGNIFFNSKVSFYFILK